MAKYIKDFVVSNASSYDRNDYVKVNLDTLGVPDELNKKSLKLLRINPSGKSEQELLYQIDYPVGKHYPCRILTFYSENTPAGKEDYSSQGVHYRLEASTPTLADASTFNQNIWVGHYYTPPLAGEPADGFNLEFDDTRKVNGVKLYNGSLEFYISLVPHLSEERLVDYTGSVTSMYLRDAPGDMLTPFDEDFPFARWGQLSELVFFPLPWEVRWSDRINMLDKQYELVWSNSGPLRAAVTLKSQPFTIRYRGAPLLSKTEIEVKCNLYRHIYAYRGQPYYTEELTVLTDQGFSISFRPYFVSQLNHPISMNTDICHLHEIPDYFSIWKSFAEQYWGYGFASSPQVREFEVTGDVIRWRLPQSHHNKCIHYFMFQGYTSAKPDPCHSIGHYGWYEQLYKPLRTIPFSYNDLSPFAYLRKPSKKKKKSHEVEEVL